MSSLSYRVNGTTVKESDVLTGNVGDTITITGLSQTTVAYGLKGDVSVPGCSYSVIKWDVYSLSGTLTTPGTYYFVKRTGSSYGGSDGSTLTLIVAGSILYYSRLHYNANTGSSAPSDDVVTTSATSKPADRNTSVSGTVPTLTGYKFKGWSKTQYPIGTGTAEYEASDIIGVPYLETDTASVTLYAVWEEEVKKQWVCSIGETKMTPHIFVDGKWVKASIGFKE